MNEYRVKVTVRNNLLLSAIEDAGYSSQSEFAAACELTPSAVNNLVGLREPPISAHLGTFSPAANAIMEVLGCAPTDLWTDAQLTMRLKRSSGERTVSENDIQSILENHIEAMTLPDPQDVVSDIECVDVVNRALDTLTKRESGLLRMRYADELTLEECAKVEGITRERIRQIEAKALRKLRHPDRAALREFA